MDLSYEEAENAFVQLIGREAARFSFLRESTKLSDVEKKQYDAFNVIKNGKYWMDKGFLVFSLKVLSQLLCRSNGQKTLILKIKDNIMLECFVQRDIIFINQNQRFLTIETA